MRNSDPGTVCQHELERPERRGVNRLLQNRVVHFPVPLLRARYSPTATRAKLVSCLAASILRAACSCSDSSSRTARNFSSVAGMAGFYVVCLRAIGLPSVESRRPQRPYAGLGNRLPAAFRIPGEASLGRMGWMAEAAVKREERPTAGFSRFTHSAATRATCPQSPPQSHASLRVQTCNIARYLRVSTATSRRTCLSRRVSRKRPTSASSTPGSIGQGLGKDACSQQSRGFCRWKLRAWGEMIEETMSGGRNGCTSQGFETDCDSPFPSHLQQHSKMRGTGRCRSNTTAPT